MRVVEVWIEHANLNINNTFTYQATGFEVQVGMRVLIPFNHRKIVGFIAKVSDLPLDETSYQETYGYAIKSIISVLDDAPIINDELLQCALYLAQQTVSPVISCLSVMFPNALKPKIKRQTIRQDAYIVPHKEGGKLSPKQQQAYQYVLDHQPLLRKELNKQFPGLLSALVAKGWVEVVMKNQTLSPQSFQLQPDLSLTPDQQEAMKQIEAADKPVLLHGATGSGKTELYLQLARKYQQQGKQVLILVPEISLTPQMIRRVTQRFGNAVAIYHSRLTDQQRYMYYQQVRNNEVSIVVGTRSAIFMPFENLGLIVLDEEHDFSYKQDSLPRYHCRDVALWRSKYHHATLILGSATPAFESYARAIKGVYQLVTLPQRIHNHLPSCRLIDTKAAIMNGESNILTNTMLAAIKDRLKKREQVLLLLNRRGHNSVVKCHHCQEALMCDDCDLAMTYHKDDHLLICHVCGKTKRLPNHCPSCGHQRFDFQGFGTQKVSEMLQQQFPQANILRMDLDTVAKKGGHQQILDEFEHHGDILVGTQMIAKGLDYPRITLVGILNADAMLIKDDFRSVETTFSLIVQASGRSGRGKTSGEVLIQAFDPQHYALQLACRHDYQRFFQEEMQYRHLGNYPPYSYLIALVVSSKQANYLDEAIEFLHYSLQDQAFQVLGPSPLIRVRQLHRQRIILKGKNLSAMIDFIHQHYPQWLKKMRQVTLAIDVNPISWQ